MTLGKSLLWAEIWEEHKKDYTNIEKAVLVDRMIKGFPNKDFEKGFREGLVAVGEVMAICNAEESNRKKLPKTKEELKKSLTNKPTGLE